MINEILEKHVNLGPHYLTEKTLKYFNILDICTPNCTNSCCFTKAYTRYIEGTGSVFTTETSETVANISQEVVKFERGSKDFFQLLKRLNLRFFTPKEVSRLMSFPEGYAWPNNVPDRQKYMVLGNSINVKVVSELIKLLQ